MDNTYELLGDTIMSEVASHDGAVVGDFDPSFIVNAAAGLATGGVKAAQDKSAADKASKDSTAAAAKSLNADAAWADAETQLDLANQSKNSTQIAAAQSLQSSTMMAALQAGTGLPADAVTKRVQAAQDAQRKAAQDSLSNPKDTAKAARMRAWQKVAAAVGGGGAMMPSAGSAPGGADSHGHHGSDDQPSFFTKHVAGLPVWGWGLVITVVGAGTALLVHKLRKH
jgi:hypothetical protein